MPTPPLPPPQFRSNSTATRRMRENIKRVLNVFGSLLDVLGGVETAAVAARCSRRLACPRRMEEEDDDGLVLPALALSSSLLPRMLKQGTTPVLLPRSSICACAGGPFRSSDDARALLLTA